MTLIILSLVYRCYLQLMFISKILQPFFCLLLYFSFPFHVLMHQQAPTGLLSGLFLLCNGKEEFWFTAKKDSWKTAKCSCVNVHHHRTWWQKAKIRSDSADKKSLFLFFCSQPFNHLPNSMVLAPQAGSHWPRVITVSAEDTSFYY